MRLAPLPVGPRNPFQCVDRPINAPLPEPISLDGTEAGIPQSVSSARLKVDPVAAAHPIPRREMKMPDSAPPPVVVGIGEVLWDTFADSRRLGGAPANFAYHARRLGADAAVASCVGDDDDGREIRDRLRDWGLDTRYLAVDPCASHGRRHRPARRAWRGRLRHPRGRGLGLHPLRRRPPGAGGPGRRRLLRQPRPARGDLPRHDPPIPRLHPPGLPAGLRREPPPFLSTTARSSSTSWRGAACSS